MPISKITGCPPTEEHGNLAFAMGVWGTGLYSGDFAMDLRTTISAVVRLPFEPDHLVDILSETEPTAANNITDEDHTRFWLIVADQFAKRGIACERVRARALEIIDGGSDLAILERFGMKAPDLRKRQKILQELRERVAATPVSKPRTTLKEPQALLMERGDVIVYPTCYGRCINPYFASKELDTQYTRNGPIPWSQDGWAAALIIDCGRAFGFLSWYRPLTLAEALEEKPILDALRGNILWRLQTAGTCSPAHFRKLEMETLGRLPVDPEKLNIVFPGLRSGISAAVSDISLANRLSSAPYRGPALPTAIPGEPARGRSPGIVGLEQILSS